MGTAFVHTSFPNTLSESELRAAVKAYTDEKRHEDGHGPYSGTLGSTHSLAIHPKHFDDVNAALDYIDSKSDKHNPCAVAVRVGKFPTPSKAFLALKTSTDTLEKDVEGFDVMVVKRAQAGKSKLRKCPNCQSSISVRHLPTADSRLHPLGIRRLTDCPVCHKNLLMTATDEKRLTSMNNTLREKQQQLRMEEEKLRKSASGCWVVGANVPS